MNVGNLNRRVILQSPVYTDTPTGQKKITGWTDAATVWAELHPLNGTEALVAQQLKGQATGVIVIRRRSDLALGPTWRAVYQGRVLNFIAPPLDQDENHRAWKILYSEVAA